MRSASRLIPVIERARSSGRAVGAAVKSSA